MKENLTAEDLRNRGLGPILQAMEVASSNNSRIKNELCRRLWPDNAFTDIFEENIQELRKNKKGEKFV